MFMAPACVDPIVFDVLGEGPMAPTIPSNTGFNNQRYRVARW